MNRKGFTLLELLLTMAILIVIGAAGFKIQRDFLSTNRFLQETLLSQSEAQSVMTHIIEEIRTAEQSDLGGYPIEIANESSFAFYANIDSDAARERVHYFTKGNMIKRSIIKSAGSPATYATSSGIAKETVTTVLYDIITNPPTPLFNYYPGTYAGTTSPLTAPVDISKIRLISVTLTTDKTLTLPPPAIVVSSKVSIRNLKDNL